MMSKGPVRGLLHLMLEPCRYEIETRRKTSIDVEAKRATDDLDIAGRLRFGCASALVLVML
jgi:hypothetical protein